MKKVLITGAAGFIGYHLIRTLADDFDIIALDNLQEYPSRNIKLDRLKMLGLKNNDPEHNKLIDTENFKFIKLDMLDSDNLDKLFNESNFDIVINLAAQTGVRYSMINPQVYIENNINAFVNLLNSCKNYNVKKLVYASSSSVYGMQSKMPYTEDDVVDSPLSVYAMTKRANELLAYTYSNLHGIHSRGLRFFTVYGPWGRTDMAAYIFMKSITEDTPIKLYNNGDMIRDFTYVSDITNAIRKVSEKLLEANHNINADNIIYNVGQSNPKTVIEYLEKIEEKIGKKAIVNNMPIQEGELKSTYADVSKLFDHIGFKPETDFSTGVDETVKWFIDYYKK